MFRTFNMGIGFILVVGRRSAARTLQRLQEMGQKAWIIGELTAREHGVRFSS
jgi:phosphoribosylformylglycinamidine cyclo-ligase